MSTTFTLLSAVLAASGVSQVVVYPDRAQVTRETSVPCGGRVLAVFEGISSAAEQGSFRARSSLGRVEGLRSEERTREESLSKRRAELEAEERKLAAQLVELQHAESRLDGQARVADRYDEVAVNLASREMVGTKPETKAWSQAFDSSLKARLAAAAQRTELKAKQRAVRQKQEDLARQLAQTRAAAARKEFRAEVLVSCPAGQQAKVELTYLVGGAGWEPSYEARAHEGEGKVELSLFASVRQSTGEDWLSTQLLLSTAVPSQNARPPEVRPLKVYSQEKEPEQKVLVAREETVQHAEADGSKSTGSGERMAVREQGLSVQMVVPQAADVRGDGTAVRLFVAREMLKATFALRSAPKRMPFVFRVADLVNSAPFPLLPGPVDAFRTTGFLARYGLERVPQGGVFHLTFGVEEGVRVKRTVLEEVKRDAGLFGGKQRFRYAYRYELANYVGRAVDVELTEQLPVSELDDVVVEVDSKTTAGYQAGKDDGLTKWKLALAPGASKSVELAFHVDVPKSYDMGGL